MKKITMSYLGFALTIFLIGVGKKIPIQKGKPLKNLTNITYGSNIDTIGNKEPLTMDIYFPPGATTQDKYPLVMMIHSGGFRAGSKQGVKKFCEILADSGFVAAAINYRLGWNIRTPTNYKAKRLDTQYAAVYRALQDANAALRFLVSKAKVYAIDTNWIFVGGASAGAVTALNMRYMTQNFYRKKHPNYELKLGGLYNADNKIAVSYSIKGISSRWGGLPDSNLITISNAIPTIFFHGTEDKTIPVDIGYVHGGKGPKFFGSLCLYRQLRTYQVPAVVHLAQGAGHGPKIYKQGDFAVLNTICFFKNIMSGNLPSGIYYGYNTNCYK
jgi:acetyl esterase/lipase